VGPRAGLDAVAKIKIPTITSAGNLIPVIHKNVWNSVMLLPSVFSLVTNRIIYFLNFTSHKCRGINSGKLLLTREQ
jgi:hypothetical protein